MRRQSSRARWALLILCGLLVASCWPAPASADRRTAASVQRRLAEKRALGGVDHKKAARANHFDSLFVGRGLLAHAAAAQNPDGTYNETVGGNANTWTNYTNAGDYQGPTIPAYATVQIACVVQGFRVADGNTNWYQIASAPWNYGYFVS